MTTSQRRDLFPGALEMMTLRLLEKQPAHGYHLVQRIRQASQDLLRVEEGSLYPALQRLLRGGLVHAAWETSSTGRRIRVYRITPKGSRHLADEVRRFEDMLVGISRVVALGDA